MTTPVVIVISSMPADWVASIADEIGAPIDVVADAEKLMQEAYANEVERHRQIIESMAVCVRGEAKRAAKRFVNEKHPLELTANDDTFADHPLET